MILVPPQYSHLPGITASALLLSMLALFPHFPGVEGCASALWEQAVGRAGERGARLGFSACCGSAEKTFRFACSRSGKGTGQTQRSPGVKLSEQQSRGW